MFATWTIHQCDGPNHLGLWYNAQITCRQCTEIAEAPAASSLHGPHSPHQPTAAERVSAGIAAVRVSLRRDCGCSRESPEGLQL